MAVPVAGALLWATRIKWRVAYVPYRELAAAADRGVQVAVPSSAQTHLDRAAELRAESARTLAQAHTQTRAAAQAHYAAGMPLWDIGELLGVSYQHATELVSEAA